MHVASVVDVHDPELPPLLVEGVIVSELASGRTVGLDVLYARAGDTIVIVGVVEPEGDTARLVELSTIAVGRVTTAAAAGSDG